jgi:hypothetical protein
MTTTNANRPALFTTVHPAAMPFLAAWSQSLRGQTYRDFDLWVAVDQVDPSEVRRVIGADLAAHYVPAAGGDTPAQVRQRGIAAVVECHPVVIFADSDDVLEPDRVGAAVEAVADQDVVGCAMRLMDEDGHQLNQVFDLPRGAAPSAVLPYGNVFGLGNTVYRAEVLRRCLPIPADCRLVDWLLATRAWGAGAKMAFDSRGLVRYRLHDESMAPVTPPFTVQQIMTATDHVLNHYACLLDRPWDWPPRHRRELEAARRRLLVFHEAISREDQVLDRYVLALNQLAEPHVWWSCVAHPRLEDVWQTAGLDGGADGSPGRSPAASESWRHRLV